MARRKAAGLDKRLDRIPGSLWKHPKTGGWYWRVRKPGEKGYTNVRVVLQGQKHATKIKTLAEARQRQMWQEWTAARPVVTRTIERWIQAFRDWNASDASGQQADYNADVVRRFCKAQGIRQPADITPQTVQQYLQDRQDSLAPGTLHHHRNAISKFCRFLEAQQQLGSNPAKHPLVVLPRIRRKAPRYLTDGQTRAFLKRLRTDYPDLYAPALFCLDTSARLSEMRGVKWRDIDQGRVTLKSSKGRADQAWRVVPLSARLRKVLKGLPADSEHVFAQHSKQQWCKMMRKATQGLPVFAELPGRRVGNQWHLLRSTWAVHMARKGADCWKLMRLGGWVDPKTVMRYINLAGVVD